MAISKYKLAKWTDKALMEDYEFVICVWDKFEEYPIYVRNMEELLKEQVKYEGRNLQKISLIIRVVDGVIFENYKLNETREARECHS